MGIKDFKGKRVTIMGLGLHGGGLGATKFFVENGANVLVTDLRKKEELKESLKKLAGLPKIRYVFGQHRDKDFINADLVIKNPAVPETSKYLEIARRNRVPIETDMGIFFELCPVSIIGVTGTRGKSTTAFLIAKFLSQEYKDVILAGNIRCSVLLELDKINKKSLVVLELSSWQLEGLFKHKKSPEIAIMTNIMPDHLNRYQGMEDYIEAKKIIFKFQTKKDWLILNEEDPIVRKFAKEAKSRVVFFNKSQAHQYETLLVGEPRRNAFGILWGEHNLSNLAAALAVAKLFKIPERKIQKVLKDFKGLEGRLELIAEINRVKYINDTSATIPEATIAAINTLESNWSPAFRQEIHPKGWTPSIILIAGGADKNLNFSQLTRIIIRKVKTLILLEGTATDKLEKAVRLQIANYRLQIDVKRTDNMEEAVKFAAQQAKAGDIVLLSPACASFGLFRHEFERGKAFNREVLKLK